MTEFRLYDDPGAEVAQITTGGDVIKPFLNAVGRVVKEAKLHVDEDGLSVTAVDSANVFMGEVAIMADAFDTYEVADARTIGLHIGNVQSAVRRARVNSDDELTLSLQERRLHATVSRGYDNHNVVSQNRVDLIDPNSIRAEPDIPELEQDVSVTLDADPFVDALSHAVSADGDIVELESQAVNQHAKALYLRSESDTQNDSVAISDVDPGGVAEAIYADHYMSEILGGIGDVDADTVTLGFDDEYPATVEVEHPTLPFRVRYTVAPRVKKGPEDRV